MSRSTINKGLKVPSDSRKPSFPKLPQRVVATDEDLHACCREIRDCRRFGLDTEFVGESTYHPQLCLVQVATDSCLYLIDPLAVADLQPFWELVANPRNLVVVHAGREESRFCHAAVGRAPGNLFDVQIAAGLIGGSYPLNHGKIVQKYLGVRVPGGETLTEWRHRPLSPEQITYALDDVRFLLPLWESLTTQLNERNRAGWAKEEFARAATESVSPPQTVDGADQKWRKLRGAGSLDRSRLGLVRALFLWRDNLAEEKNRPVRAILRDDLLVEIARKSPKNEGDIQRIRGVPKKLSSGIHKAITQARRLSADELPKPIPKENDPPQLGLIAQFLTAFLADYCAQHHISQSIIANQQEIKTLIRSTIRRRKLPADNVFNSGWRKREILPQLKSILSGDVSVRIANIRAESPFEVASTQ